MQDPKLYPEAKKLLDGFHDRLAAQDADKKAKDDQEARYQEKRRKDRNKRKYNRQKLARG